MTDAALMVRLLREYRLGGLDPGDVPRWSGSVSGTCVGYLVTVPGGERMVVQAFGSDVPLAMQFRGCANASVAGWPGSATPARSLVLFI